MTEDQISVVRQIPENAIFVYATKYKSYFEYLFYHIRFQHEKIPSPQLGFDYKIHILQPLARILRIMLSAMDSILFTFSLPNPYKSGYMTQELLNNKAALLSLVGERVFYLRYVKSTVDPIQYLIEMQASTDRPVYIIPQIMFFSKNPHRSKPTLVDVLFGSEGHPGKLRRFAILFQNPKKIFVEISEPMNLKKFLERADIRELNSQQQASVVRIHLIDQLNRHRQSITGPILKAKEELKQSILTSERLQAYMDNYSESKKIPMQKVHQEANEYVDEIAAKYNLSTIRIFAWFVHWVSETMFEGITVNTQELNRVKAAYRKGPLVFIPCHKSHIDYLVISYILFENNMPCPHVAAGKNLSFWPLGPIFRRGGAFFIRRTFKGAILYSKVFSEYVYKLMEEEFNLEFFIEGGRSRTGKLLSPKLGLLSILLSAFRDGACDDLIFVPMYIGYDRVPEESSYLYELEGGEKKPESLMQIFKARKFLSRRYGRIYVNFHPPISLNDYMAQRNTHIRDMGSKEQNTLCRILGNQLLHAIDKCTVVTPHGVVAGAILNGTRQTFSYENLISDVETYMNYLINQKVQLAETLIIDPNRATEYVIEAYLNRKCIEPLTKTKDIREAQFSVNPARRQLLDYYKNNCINFFIPAAYTSLAILEKDAFQFSATDLHAEYRFFQELFTYEFSHDTEKTPEYMVRKALKAFIDDAILMPHQSMPDTYNMTSAGFRKLKLFSGFLKTYLESYWIVLQFFKSHPQSALDADKRLKKMYSIGKRMQKQKEVELPESLSGVNFKNAVEFFMSHHIKGLEDMEPIELYSNRIETALSYLSQ